MYIKLGVPFFVFVTVIVSVVCLEAESDRGPSPDFLRSLFLSQYEIVPWLQGLVSFRAQPRGQRQVLERTASLHNPADVTNRCYGWSGSRLPDFSWSKRTQTGKVYQMATNYVYQMAVKYNNLFHSKALQNKPILGFLVLK
jgi:hypothetical protein